MKTTALADRTALITGANSGIGLELTRKLLAEGWQIIALIRSGFPEGDSLLQGSLNTGQLRTYHAELTDFASLKRALTEIKAKEKKVDVLFNNAGSSLPRLSFSRQGREMHYELLTVVPYIITMELKELLKRGNLKTVIHTSSAVFLGFRRFDPDKLERPTKFKKLVGPYATGKLALTLWSQELAPVLAAEGIQIRSVDPGGNNTVRSGSSGLPFLLVPIMKLFFSHPSVGAARLYEGAVGEHRKLTGVFLVKGQVKQLQFAQQHARKVLEQVRDIYELEFAEH